MELFYFPTEGNARKYSAYYTFPVDHPDFVCPTGRHHKEDFLFNELAAQECQELCLEREATTAQAGYDMNLCTGCRRLIARRPCSSDVTDRHWHACKPYCFHCFANIISEESMRNVTVYCPNKIQVNETEEKVLIEVSM